MIPCVNSACAWYNDTTMADEHDDHVTVTVELAGDYEFIDDMPRFDDATFRVLFWHDGFVISDVESDMETLRGIVQAQHAKLGVVDSPAMYRDAYEQRREWIKAMSLS